MEKQSRFLKEIHSTLEEKDWSQMRKFSSEAKSLYSDLSEETNQCWQLSIPKTIRRNPRYLISNLIILSRIRPFWYQNFIVFCGEQCKKFNYQGEWRTLHKLLKLNYHDLILYRITEIMSGNDYFGNYDSLIDKFLEFPQISFRKLLLPRPKRIQRKRGYNDHGSRKNPHEIHSCFQWTGENPEKQDYSDQYKKNSIFLNFLYG